MNFFMKLIKNKYLSQTLDKKEAVCLRILSSNEAHIIQDWQLLWEGVHNFDDLSQSCKTLMPVIVKYIESKKLLDECFNSVGHLNLSFLRGFPKYFWVKNQHLLKNIDLILSAVHDNIQIIAIKGTAEILDSSCVAFYRSTRDLDLLVKSVDIHSLRRILLELNYYEVIENKFIKYPFNKTSYYFKSRLNSYLDVDVHVSVNTELVPDNLTNLFWLNRVPSNTYKNLSVPSNREKFWLAVINAFMPENWVSGSYLKYINDALDYASAFPKEKIQSIVYDGKQLHGLKDWQEQIISLGIVLGRLQDSYKEEIRTQVAYGSPRLNKHTGVSLEFTRNISISVASKAMFYKIYYRLNNYQIAIKRLKKNGYVPGFFTFILFAPLVSAIRGTFSLFKLILFRKYPS